MNTSLRRRLKLWETDRLSGGPFLITGTQTTLSPANNRQATEASLVTLTGTLVVKQKSVMARTAATFPMSARHAAACVAAYASAKERENVNVRACGQGALQHF